MRGRYVEVAPLVASDAVALWEGNEPSQWTYLPDGPWDSYEAFAAFVAGLEGFVAFRVDGVARGFATYMREKPEHRTIEIGYIWLGAGLARTRASTEAIFLLLAGAFERGMRRVEWKCNAVNEPSRRAALRYGFVFEGVFRQHMLVKGRNRDTAWYSMLDSEWPGVRAGFERWLDPANFDARGVQRSALLTSEGSAARLAGR